MDPHQIGLSLVTLFFWRRFKRIPKRGQKDKIWLRCSRGGNIPEVVGQKRKHGTSRLNEWLFQCILKLDKKEDMWHLRVKEKEHNHEPGKRVAHAPHRKAAMTTEIDRIIIAKSASRATPGEIPYFQAPRHLQCEGENSPSKARIPYTHTSPAQMVACIRWMARQILEGHQGSSHTPLFLAQILSEYIKRELGGPHHGCDVQNEQIQASSTYYHGRQNAGELILCGVLLHGCWERWGLFVGPAAVPRYVYWTGCARSHYQYHRSRGGFHQRSQWCLS